MIKRLSLLLATMFVASMMFAAPVFASGDNHWNNGNDNVCVVHNNHNGDDWSNGNHDEWWCDHNNGDHNGNHNGNHNNNNNNNDHNNNNNASASSSSSSSS